MESWPIILPAPSSAFNGDVATSTIETQMDSGRVRSRQRFTRQNNLYKVTWEMDDFEYGMFQSWVLYKLHNGADQFEIDLPTGGIGMKTVVARIVRGEYSASHKETLNWVVTANLRVDDAKVFTENEFDTLYELGSISELEAAAEALHLYITG